MNWCTTLLDLAFWSITTAAIMYVTPLVAHCRKSVWNWCPSDWVLKTAPAFYSYQATYISN